MGSGRPLGLFKALLVGTASAQLYYLLVYAQLVLLTPWLYRTLRSRRVVMYAITPAVLVLRESLGVFGLSLPGLGSLFITWLIFYLMGLDWPRWKARLEGVSLGALALLLACALLLQEASSFAWNAHCNYDLATTQLKLSSMFTSMAFICAAMKLPAAWRARAVGSTWLVRLGDLSFGVYLCHMLVLAVVRKVFVTVGADAYIACFVIWLVTLGISALCVAAARRLLPDQALRLIGFA